MVTKTIYVNQKGYKESELKPAVDVIKRGGLVAFPTETVYGLGGNALDPTVVDKIYKAKGRPSDNPLILHVSQWEDVMPLASDVPEGAKKLSDAFWPGPLTIIFHKSDAVPKEVTGGRDTVAIRIPNHRLALDFIRLSGVPIAAPSANASGRPSPTLAKHVKEDLDGKIDVILDGGAVGIGIESTIVDMTGDAPIILRPGYITEGMLEEIMGRVRHDHSDEPKAPGMKYKHYAPKGELVIVEGDRGGVICEINRRAKEKPHGEVGIITTEEAMGEYPFGIVRSMGPRSDEEGIARELYKVLREFDEKGVKYIYTESFHSDGLGRAIMNRLTKAANNQVVRIEPGSRTE